MKNIRFIDGHGYLRVIQPQDPDFPPVLADAADFELSKLLEAPYPEKFQLVRVFALDDAPETEAVDDIIARWAAQYDYALLEKVLLLAWTNHINSLNLPATSRVRSMHAWLIPSEWGAPSAEPDFVRYGIKFWNLP